MFLTSVSSVRQDKPDSAALASAAGAALILLSDKRHCDSALMARDGPFVTQPYHLRSQAISRRLGARPTGWRQCSACAKGHWPCCKWLTNRRPCWALLPPLQLKTSAKPLPSSCGSVRTAHMREPKQLFLCGCLSFAQSCVSSHGCLWLSVI